MSKRPQDTPAEEPDGGNPHIRFRGGPRQGDRPGLLNNANMMVTLENARAALAAARSWSKLLACGTLVCFGIVFSSGARAGTDDGWYTQDQAQHGHITFNTFCAECHRPDLKGALGPALIGDAFLQAWLNKPLGDLFTFEETKMPANNPGSVPGDKMWLITAYILQKNGFPAGSTPLSAQAESRALVAPSSVRAANETSVKSR